MKRIALILCLCIVTVTLTFSIAEATSIAEIRKWVGSYNSPTSEVGNVMAKTDGTFAIMYQGQSYPATVSGVTNPTSPDYIIVPAWNVEGLCIMSGGVCGSISWRGKNIAIPGNIWKR